MRMPLASLTQGLLLHPCINASAPALLFTLLCCQMEFHFARHEECCCWLGPLLRLCQCWQGRCPQQWVLQAPSYAVFTLEARACICKYIALTLRIYGHWTNFFSLSSFTLCLWGVRFLPPNFEYDPLHPIKLHSCATTAPLFLPTRHASLQQPAYN